MSRADEPVSMVPSGGCIDIGLTIREHFAAMAMQGLVSNEFATDKGSLSGVAATAVEMADALIEALAKEAV